MDHLPRIASVLLPGPTLSLVANQVMKVNKEPRAWEFHSASPADCNLDRLSV